MSPEPSRRSLRSLPCFSSIWVINPADNWLSDSATHAGHHAAWPCMQNIRDRPICWNQSRDLTQCSYSSRPMFHLSKLKTCALLLQYPAYMTARLEPEVANVLYLELWFGERGCQFEDIIRILHVGCPPLHNSSFGSLPAQPLWYHPC